MLDKLTQQTGGYNIVQVLATICDLIRQEQIQAAQMTVLGNQHDEVMQGT